MKEKISGVSGVYGFRNTQNNKIYVGSGKSTYGRFCNHLNNLRKGAHPSKDLQYDWDNTIDKNIFQLEILEVINNPLKDLLFSREQFYIDHFSQLKLIYNHTHNARGGNGKGEKHAFWGRPVPLETRDKISETLTGRELSEEHRSNIGKAQIGHTRITPEIAERTAQQNRKLSDDEAISILKRIECGETLRSILKDFKDVISYSTIKGIKKGVAYAHILRNQEEVK